MLGFWPLLAWATEFLLEISGSFLAFRKRLKILSVLLVWRAFMDVVTFVIFALRLHPGYGFTMWAGRAVQYAILYALGVQLAAKMIQDYRPLTRYIYMTIAVGVSVGTWAFVTAELWAHKFAFAEAISCFMLLAVVLLGWIGRKKRLEEPWSLVAFGLVSSAFGNAICSAVSARWPIGLNLYPIPAIAALIVWNWAASQRQLGEFRREIPTSTRELPKKPVQSAREPRMLSERIN